MLVFKISALDTIKKKTYSFLETIRLKKILQPLRYELFRKPENLFHHVQNPTQIMSNFPSINIDITFGFLFIHTVFVISKLETRLELLNVY